MSVNAKELIKKLKGEPGTGRGNVNLYLTKSIYKEFSRICEENGISPSKAIDEIMADFNASTKNDEKLSESSNPNLTEAINLLKSLDPEALDSATGLLRKAAKHSAYLKKTK